jgi:hypothetical protein
MQERPSLTPTPARVSNEPVDAGTPFQGWENFYVIVGSSAGALIGLQFVVITLIADLPSDRADRQASGAFATPSVVHFGSVLLLSAIASAPWSEIAVPAALWGLLGTAGALYVLLVSRRMRAQTAYQPVFEDWLFHALLPLAAYAALVVSALTIASWKRSDLFLIGAAALVLLFVGIHNAWDAVTYHVFVQRRERRKAGKEP